MTEREIMDMVAHDSGRLNATLRIIAAKASAYSGTKYLDLATCTLSEIVDICDGGIKEHEAMLEKLTGGA